MIHVTDENNNPACTVEDSRNIIVPLYSYDKEHVNCPRCIEKFNIPQFGKKLTLADICDDDNLVAWLDTKD